MNGQVPVEQEEHPNEPIKCFEVGRRDGKKAKRMRAFLASDAPGVVGDTIIMVPIVITPRIRKNRMFAVAESGERILEINLKSGSIDFVIPEVAENV